MYCGGTIKVGEKYERQTNLYEGQIYDWVAIPNIDGVIETINTKNIKTIREAKFV